MKYTYSLINIFSILVPFLFSFHPKIRFYRHWPALFPAIIVTGILFICWDAYFAHLKIWRFNPTYVIGLYIGNLPIEEVLFFLCIPYSCVFTYHCLNLNVKQKMSGKVELLITSFLIIASISLAVMFNRLSYTVSAFALLAVLLLASRLVWKVSWLPNFYFAYLVLLIPFLIVNGILTGTGLKAPVVLYNSSQILNLRILTIPVEDVFYGMDLFILNVLIYSFLSKKSYLELKLKKKAVTEVNI